jgi:hypothetical protein
MEQEKQQIVEPSILTANTYFWSPERNANSRRRSELKKLKTVSDFLEKLGMEVTNSYNINTVDAKVVSQNGDKIEVVFSYRESAKNVYKSLCITKNGENSNITTLRKLYK